MRAVVILTAAALLAPVAARADCAAEADRLAGRYGVSTEIPQGGAPRGEAPATTDESRGMAPETLSRSGGVIAPPETAGRGRVIQPPPAVAPSMPTAPQIRPEPRTGDMQGEAAKTAQVESLLTAARAAARRGDEAECEQRVEEARAIGGDPG